MDSAKSKGDLDDDAYMNMKDSKKISESEAKFLELKNQKTQQGIKMMKQHAYTNQEFAD